ncbi:MAG: metal-dependent transcriptional regulator [Clostridiales bacterium]|nr:metal-dependent transcriptional regulator [Clostridiales bacterium]
MRESGEMYLETVYCLLKDRGRVFAVDVCDALSYAKSSVSRGINNLKKQGYLTADDKNGLLLTEEGLKKAESVFERHAVLTAFLMKIGVAEDVAEQDACKIEHVISVETLNAIKEELKK